MHVIIAFSYPHTVDDFYFHLSKIEELMERKGSISMSIIHLMPFGPPRIGKTSVKDRLAGKKPKGEPARKEHDRIVHPDVKHCSKSTGAADDTIRLYVEQSSSATYRVEEKWVEYDFDEEVISVIKGLESLVKTTDEREFHSDSQLMISTEDMQTQIELPQTDRLGEEQAATPQHSLHSSEKVNPAVGDDEKFKEYIDPFQPVADAFNNENSSKVKALVENSLTIHFTDTGGQPEFQEIIPMLVAGPSLFLLIFNLATKLDHTYEVRYDAVDEEIEPYMSSFTVQSVMLQCLASIACIGTQVGKTRPKVLFIGTHLDLLTDSDSQLRQISKQLWDAITGLKLGDLVIRNERHQIIFAVDNYDQSNENAFDAIRKKVTKDKELYKVDLPVPFVLLDFYLRQPKECRLDEKTCSRILKRFGLKMEELERFLKKEMNKTAVDICDPKLLAEAVRVLSNKQIPPETELLMHALMELNEKSHKRNQVISMKQFKTIATKCNVTSDSELKEALWTLHHLLGTIRHFPDVPELADTVITDQQLFFDVHTKLITRTFQRRSNSCCDRFLDEGFFTRHDLDKVWEQEKAHLTSDQLVALLQHLHILAPVKREDGSCEYFLPCVLKHARNAEAPKQPFSTPHKQIVDPLLVSFGFGFTPNGMFSGLLAFLMKYNKDGLTMELRTNQLFRDQASFLVKRHIYLMITAFPEYICFTLTHPENETVNTSGICTTVKRAIETGLNELGSRLNYNEEDAMPVFGFKCTCENPEPTHFTEYSSNPVCSLTQTSCNPPSSYSKWFEGKTMVIVFDSHITLLYFIADGASSRISTVQSRSVIQTLTGE